MDNTNNDLIIDEEFTRLMLPYSDDEYDRVRGEILRRRKALIYVWNGIIADGYEEHMISVELGVSAKIRPLSVNTREEATIWICRKQLKRTDLTLQMKKYLIGKISVAEQAYGEKNPGADRRVTHLRTDLGNEYSYCQSAVRDYERCAKTIDMLFAADRRLTEKLLREKIFLPQGRLIDMSKLSFEQVKAAAEALSNTKGGLGKAPTAQKSYPDTAAEAAPSIKNMPKYDPDAEISSLSLTIPSWINSIERIRKRITTQISSEAADELYDVLNRLNGAVNGMIESIMEVL